MRRDNIFWGGALILVGVLLFLQTQGIIGNIFQYFWPLALILVGGWIILGVYWKPDGSAGESFSLPLGAAQSVNYHFADGAGQLEISGGAPVGQAMVGTAAAGMNRTSQLSGDRLDVRIEAGPSFVPFLGPSQGRWQFQLAQNIPVVLTVEFWCQLARSQFKGCARDARDPENGGQQHEHHDAGARLLSVGCGSGRGFRQYPHPGSDCGTDPCKEQRDGLGRGYQSIPAPGVRVLPVGQFRFSKGSLGNND